MGISFSLKGDFIKKDEVFADPAVAEACSRVIQIEDGRIVEEV